MIELPKDPQSTLDYALDWTQWLSGDVIVASQWSVPTGISRVTDTHTDTIATIWVSGGTVGNVYVLTNRITTGAGRTDERSFRLRCSNR